MYIVDFGGFFPPLRILTAETSTCFYPSSLIFTHNRYCQAPIPHKYHRQFPFPSYLDRNLSQMLALKNLANRRPFFAVWRCPCRPYIGVLQWLQTPNLLCLMKWKINPQSSTMTSPVNTISVHI